MNFARSIASLGACLTLGACVGSSSTPMSGVIVVPGPGKDMMAFQADQAFCQQSATSPGGYGSAPQAPAPNAAASPQTPDDLDALYNPGVVPGTNVAGQSPNAAGQAVPVDAGTPVGLNYVQCMAARGDSVQMASMGDYDPGYGFAGYGDYGSYAATYPYPYPNPYDYGYGYGYPFYDGIYGLGLGFGAFGYGGWGYGGWGRGYGWGRGGYGGYGRFGRGGYGRFGRGGGMGRGGGGGHGGGGHR